VRNLLRASALIWLSFFTTAARANVIDTFSFANADPGFFGSSNWTVPISEIAGRFTGTVEPDGIIGLSDLSAFFIAASISNAMVIGADSNNVLSFFTYDTNGGASSLGMIAVSGMAIACVGAPSVLSLTCNPGGLNPQLTLASINDAGAAATTPDLTTITLLSSVSTPEPSTWAMLGLGFAGLGWMRYRHALAARPIA
jgi:PEP-CTERM motif